MKRFVVEPVLAFVTTFTPKLLEVNAKGDAALRFASVVSVAAPLILTNPAMAAVATVMRMVLPSVDALVVTICEPIIWAKALALAVPENWYPTTSFTERVSVWVKSSNVPVVEAPTLIVIVPLAVLMRLVTVCAALAFEETLRNRFCHVPPCFTRI